MEFTSKQMTQDRHKISDVKKTMYLSSLVTKVREFNLLADVVNALHISLDKSGGIWVSDWGKLVQTDLQGNLLQTIQTTGEDEGYHTVTQDGDLIFADCENNVINKTTQDDDVTDLIKTEEWKPISIASSNINGDILMGMTKDGEAKVTRYNGTGNELQNIQKDDKEQELFSGPHCITENSNGDACVSDINKQAVVVVNKSGQHRFSYTGQGSLFLPYGICTDVLGHILVCDYNSSTVHLLNQNGQFLSLLLNKQHGIEYPRSVCVDDENNLYVGQRFINTVSVFKYLQ